MSRLLDFLWLTLRCMVFIGAMSAALILILFTIGTEAEGYSWGERFLIALKYAVYVGVIFGGLLAMTLSLKSWRIEHANQKKLARKEQRREKANPK